MEIIKYYLPWKYHNATFILYFMDGTEISYPYFMDGTEISYPYFMDGTEISYPYRGNSYLLALLVYGI